MFQYGFWDGIADEVYLTNFSQKVKNVMNSLEHFRSDSDCKTLFQGPESGFHYFEAVNKSASWRFEKDEDDVFYEIESAENKCEKLREVYPFLEKPLSTEEEQYPIGYGMLVYSGLQQIMYELSSFYQPQNAYCIAVDGRSTNTFLRRMRMVEKCYPNIHIFQSAPVDYCRFEIINSLWKCVEKLTLSNHPWKYFQYISGVDLPLKTNKEMVRIFKAMNGSFNIDLVPIEKYRIPKNKPPVQMWKSSMSSLFSREAANFMIKNPKIQHYLKNLRHGECQDESLWGTIAGQPDVFPMPGGFNGTELLRAMMNQQQKMKRIGKIKRKPTQEEPFPLTSFYISRYQVWDRINVLNAGMTCKGAFVKGSCVFGPNSLDDLIVRSELVVHKIYFDMFPSTFFCLYEKVWERALNVREQENFNANSYSNLALVKYQKTGSLNGIELYF